VKITIVGLGMSQLLVLVLALGGNGTLPGGNYTEVVATSLGFHYTIALDIAVPGTKGPRGDEHGGVVLDTGSADLLIFGEQGVDRPDAFTKPAWNHSILRPTSCSHSLVVDLQATISFANCSLYNTSIAIVPSAGSNGPVPQVQSTNITYSESVNTRSEFHGNPHWTNATGLMGLAYKEMAKDSGDEGPKLSTFTSLLESVQLKGRGKNQFGLDFNPPGEESYVHLGGLKQDVHWGETPPDEFQPQANNQRRLAFTADGYHTFTMFHLSVCGVGLFANMSSYWTAIVDTGKWLLACRCALSLLSLTVVFCHFRQHNRHCRTRSPSGHLRHAHEVDPKHGRRA
jgi:hypothetical protein